MTPPSMLISWISRRLDTSDVPPTRSVVGIADVRDRHVTAADRRALWRRAYPGGGNFQAARGNILSLCRPCHENGKRGDESKTSRDELQDEGRRWTCPARRVCVDCDLRPAGQAGGAVLPAGTGETAVVAAAIGKSADKRPLATHGQ